MPDAESGGRPRTWLPGFSEFRVSGFRPGMSARGEAALGLEFREITVGGVKSRRTKTRTDNPEKAA